MLRVGICDDEAAARELTAGLVKRWAADRELPVRVSEYPSAESFLFAWEDEKADIILLDIEMPGMDGVALAKRLRAENDRAQIVFITGFAEYIEEGYEVEALHFLLKPVREEKLFSVLDRAARRISRAERTLTLECAGETARLPLSEIVWAEVRSNYVTVHAKRDYTAKMTLSELERGLDGSFYRVGRSCIVNLTKISRVTRTDVFLRDGTAVPLPRGAFDAVNRAIIAMEGTHGAF